MKYQKPNLKDLDNLEIFSLTMIGLVHPTCSPWSPYTLKYTYSNSENFKHRCEYPLIRAIPRSGDDCVVCQRIFSQGELVMTIPATEKEVEAFFQEKAQQNCQCPSLLRGHDRTCQFLNRKK